MAISKAQRKAGTIRRVKVSQARSKQSAKRLRVGKTPPMKQKSPGPTPKQAKRRVLKGQVSLAARATVFARQQREQRVRSIVGRKGRGKLTPAQQQELQRKTFAGAVNMEVLAEQSVNSSWVSMIHLIMYAGQPALGVTFRSGVTVIYTRSSLKDYEAMAAAGSKGKFIWARLYHGIPGAGSPYTIVVF